MKILVIGATGVIGRRVVPKLLAEGHEVTALVRRVPEAGALPERVGYARADIFDPAELIAVMMGHSAVINLATAMPSAPWKMIFRSAWRENDRIRSEGVGNLVDAAILCGIDTFIQESFAFAYPGLGSEWISEEISLTPSRYSRTLLDAERSLARFGVAGGRSVVLRFAAFYGPDAMQTRDMAQWVRRGFAPIAGRRDAYISSVSHDDAADAVAAALHVPAGIYNVGDDEPLTHAAFFNTLARALGAADPRLLPDWSKYLFGSVGEAMARSIRLSSAKLQAASGWQPRWPNVAEAWPTVLASLERGSP
jgi:nucleoside-diphosphate-sugar epimerase